MKNEDRIVELLAEMVRGQDRLTEEVTEVVKGQNRLTGEVSLMKDEITQMKKEMFKQSLQLAENSRAILKLADEIRLVAEHEKRISKLELTVFK